MIERKHLPALATSGRRGRAARALLAGALVATTVVVAPVAVPGASAAGIVTLVEKNVSPVTTLGSPAYAGDTLSYTISYDCSGTNQGDNCTGAVLTDLLPSFTDINGATNQLEFVSASATTPSDWTFQGVSGTVPTSTVSWVGSANLLAGDTGALILVLRVPRGVVPFGPVSQQVSNTASVALTGQTDDTAGPAVSYINAHAPSSSISKSGPSTALLNAAGTDNISHSIAICAQLGSPVWENYTVTDTLPVGVTVVLPLPYAGVYTPGTPSTSAPGPLPGDPPVITPGTGGTIVWTLTPANRPPISSAGCMSLDFQVHYVNMFAAGDLTNVIGATKTNTVAAVGSNAGNVGGGPQNIGPASTTLTLAGPVTRFSPAKNSNGNYFVQNGDAVTYNLGASNTSDAEAVAFSTAMLTDGPFPTGFTLGSINTGTWTGAGSLVTASIETSPNGSSWTQVSTSQSATVVAGPGVQYVRWVFTSVGVPAIGPGWGASGQQLVGTIAGSPPPSVQRTNCVGLTGVQSGVQQNRGAACATVELETPQPHPSVAKSAPGTIDPGTTVTYSLVAANASDSTASLVDPQLTDCVPYSAAMVVSNLRAGGVPLPANGWALEFGPTPGSCTPTTPATPNSGTFIQLQYTGTLAPGQAAPTVTYDVTADAFEVPLIADRAALPGTYVNTVVVANANGSPFAHCVQANCSAAHSLQVPVLAELRSQKLVWGALDNQWNKAGTTTPGGAVSWKVDVQNIGNVEVENVQYVDVFGYIGDTGVRVANQLRGSEYTPFLVSLITAPPGWTVEYSLTNNPCRPEVLGPNTGCVAPNWTSTPDLLDLPLYRSIRLTFSGRIGVGETLSFEYDMVTPVFDPTYDTPSTTASPYDLLAACSIPTSPPGDSSLQGTRTELPAWVDNGAGGGIANDGIQQPGEGGPTCPRSSNTFAYGVSVPSDQLGGLPNPGRLGAEPPKVDLFVVAAPRLNTIGNRVWDDHNNDGIQGSVATEPGIPFVRVDLLDGTGAYLATTFTDLNGNYLFEGLPDGNYRVRFYMPDDRGYISPSNQSGSPLDQALTANNTDDDSDIPQSPTGTDGAGNYYDTTTVTLGNDPGSGLEADPTWDAGIWLSQPTILLKKYVNGNDAQTTTGPSIPRGAAVTWTYDITNTGNAYLKNVTLTDDVTISAQADPVPVCDWASSSDPATPANVLSRGETVSCTASGTAIRGQYGNNATVVGTPTLDDGVTPISGKVDASGNPVPSTVTDSDPAHYFGVEYDLAIAKIANVTSVTQGGSVTWTIRVVNQGNVASLAYTVRDTIPSGLTVSGTPTAVPAATSSSVSGRLYTWVMPSLAAGGTANITIVTTVSDINQRPFRNWAEIAADSSATYSTTDFDSTPNVNTGDDSGVGLGTTPDDLFVDNLSLSGIPDTVAGDEDDNDPALVTGNVVYDLALVKTVNPTPLIGPDGLATWTITVKNQGNLNSLAYTVTDNVPDGLLVLSTVPSATSTVGRTLTWTMPNLAPGQTATITISTQVTDQAFKPFVNWAEIATDSAGFYTVPGETIVDIDSTPDAFIGDDPSAGSGSGPTNAGSTPEPNIDRTANADVNTDILGDEDDSDQAVLNSDILYDLALVKTAASPFVAPDGTITWTISVLNQGNVASGAYTVTDTVPAGLAVAPGTTPPTGNAGQVYDWDMPSLAPGATATITLVTTISDINQRPFRNWAEISADSSADYATFDEDSTPDTDTGADTGGGSDTGSMPNDVAVDQTVLPVTQHNPAGVDEDDNDFAVVDVALVYDLALSKTVTPTLMDPAGSVTWTIVVQNQGNVPSGAFVVRDVLPNGMALQSSAPVAASNPSANVYTFDVANLAPGASTTITIVTTISDINQRPFRNVAEISSDSASTYNIPGLIVSDVDSVPDANTSNDGSYPAVGAPAGTGIDNLVIADAGVLGGDPQDDADIADVNVDMRYDLALAKVVDATDLALNGVLTGTATFTVTVQNQGTVPSHAYTVTDWVPVGIEPVQPIADGGVWDIDARTITWTMGDLLPGATTTRSYDVTISDITARPYRNVAEISADSAGDYTTPGETVVDADSTPDNVPTNDGTYPAILSNPGDGIDNLLVADAGIRAGDPQDDADIADLTYPVVYDLALVKVNDGNAVVLHDEQIQFTITVQNQGNVQAHEFVVTDTLPAGLAVVDAAGGVVTGTTITWTIDDLAPGDIAEITFTMVIDDITQRPYRNTAEISADSADDYDSRGVDVDALLDVEDADSIPDADTSNDGTYPPLLVVPVPGTDSDNLEITEAGVETGDAPPAGEDDADIADVGVSVEYDLALAKVPDTTSILPDGSVVFTINIENQGSVPSGDFTVTDTLPPGTAAIAASDDGVIAGSTVTWNLAGLAPGDVRSVTVTVVITDITLRPFKNIAEISADGADLYDALDDSQPGADVEDIDSLPDADPANDNGGPADGYGTFENPTNDLDDIADVDSLPNGEDDADVAFFDAPVVYDLALVKTGPASIDGAGTATFTISVKNQGNVGSGTFTVVDTLPAGLEATEASDGGVIAGDTVTWTLSGLAAGDTTSVTMTVRVADFSTRPWVNFAEIASDGADDYDTSGYESPIDGDVEDDDSIPNGDIEDDVLVDQTLLPTDQYNDPTVDEDDHDIAPLAVLIDYDLALVKVLPIGQSFKKGNSITFDILVKNQGNVSSGPVSVQDVIPAGLLFVSADHGGLAAGQVVSWDIADMAPGEIVTLVLVVQMDVITLPSYVNFAEIVADGADAYDLDGDDVEDEDSTPDADITNDPLIDTDDPNIDVIPGDEDDHDRAFLDPAKVRSDNPRGGTLPSTGGDGSPLLLGAAGLLAAGAISLIVARRRRRTMMS
ncbi:MAG: SdrD B-like domain-containing protein [Actinomycetota bacterium]|nr:SdrD B-like domain-containing protein [Actinomycetota bacterium]